jgi:acyl-CoA thioesterase FadM
VPVVTGATARFVYQIRRLPDGEELALGHTVHACIDARGKVARIPKTLRELLSGGAPPPPPAPASGR